MSNGIQQSRRNPHSSEGGSQHFVLHHFRRTASPHLHEMGRPSDAIKKALAYSIKGVKGVCNRVEYTD
jgi:hypothetical protein